MWEQGQDYIKILNRIVRGLIWKVTFESKPEGGERARHLGTQGSFAKGNQKQITTTKQQVQRP